MKESIGGISLFTIVIVFVMLFTGYVCLSINYSKAYNVKNELVNIIKNQGGICTEGIASSNCSNLKSLIQDYFKEVNYASKGKCGNGWYGFSRTGEHLGEGANNAAFCIKGTNANSNSELPKAVFYQIRVFYQIDLQFLIVFLTLLLRVKFQEFMSLMNVVMQVTEAIIGVGEVN